MDGARSERNPSAWWREWEVGFLILLVVGAYFVRAGDLTVRGEESRRGQVAFEMIDRGDWLTPRQQGTVYTSRPPLQNWLIALSSLAIDARDAWAIRLPSLLATLLTVLLIYGTARTYQGRLGAFAAATAYATFGEILSIGSQGETEALFILLVSASLLLWHAGYVRAWPAALTWGLGYSAMALAALTKGIQAPVYFLVPVVLFLLLRGQARLLWSRGHLVGACLGVGILLAWVLPYWQAEGWTHVRLIWTRLARGSFTVQDWWHTAANWVRFPFELLGSTLPWSPLLLAFAYPAWRRALGPNRRADALFLGLAFGVALPTVWFATACNTRYLSPVYPCLAALIGMVVEACATAALPATLTQASPARFWRIYLRSLSAAMVVTGVGVLFASVAFGDHPTRGHLAETPAVAAGFALAAALLAALLWKGAAAVTPTQARQAVMIVAVFAVLSCVGILLNVRVRSTEDIAGAVAQLKSRLPADADLVSLNLVHHVFAYHYKDAIPVRPMTKETDEPLPEGTLFCIDIAANRRPQLPFPWEEIGTVPTGRYYQRPPQNAVLVGRVLPHGGVSTSTKPESR